MKKKISLINLGCPRNLVDAELILGVLARDENYLITDEIEGSDLVIINTCAFVESAKNENIDAILKAVDLKRDGKLGRIVVAGCFGQRYTDELNQEIPEIDAVLGIDSFRHIEEAVKTALAGKKFTRKGSTDIIYPNEQPRMLTTPPHYTYLKIAEGCRNCCSYCIINKIRGSLRSRTIESVIEEFKRLSESGKLSEINIIAQDTTSYGTDIYKETKLAQLLSKISVLNKVHWIRLLYTHPAYFTDELIQVIAENTAICKYIDLPIQHINDKILKKMNRNTTSRQIRSLIAKIRGKIPNVAIRTSIIVGFPGETDKDFKELLGFVRDTRFERLGVFIYSKEEDTPAYSFAEQLSEDDKHKRFDTLMALQQKISVAHNRYYLGKTIEVLIDEKLEKQGNYIGRTEYDAPEVDGQVYVHSENELKPGDFVNIEITDTLEYDLVGSSYESSK